MEAMADEGGEEEVMKADESVPQTVREKSAGEQ